MASFLGTTFENTPVQSSVNLPLVQTVLAMKQGTYDANKAKLQAGLDQLSSLQVLRPQDQEYIQAKTEELTNKINDYGNRDLSQSYVADDLFNVVKGVAKDPFIQSAIENTTKYNNYNLKVDEIRKKHPELYSDVNYSYGLDEAGFSNYMKGEANKLGNLDYIPYKDLTEEHLKKLKIIKDLKGKRFIEVSNNDGTIQRKEIDGMTNQEVQQYFGSIMTPDELQQMKINGWSKYGQEEQTARTNYGDYNTKLVGVYEDQLKLAEAKSNNNSLPQSEREDAKREVDAIKSDIVLAKQNISNKDKLNIKDISLELEKASYLSNLSNIASTEWSYEYKLDPVWKAKEDLKLQYEDLAIKKSKEQREQVEFGYKMAKEYGVDANGKKIEEDRTSVSSRREDLPEDVSGLKSLQEASTEQFNIVIDTTKELMNKIAPSQKEQFLQELKKRGVDANLQKIGNGRVIITDAIREAFDATGLGAYKEYADTISEASMKKDAIARDIITVEKDAYVETFKKNPKKYIESLKTGFERARFDYLNTSQTPDRAEETRKTFTNIEKYVKDNGGWDNLQKNIEEDPLKVREFASVFNKNRYGMRGSLSNLTEDSKQGVENKLKDYSVSGKVSTFTVYNDVNILKEEDKVDIIKRIPQERLQGGENFNQKLGMSVRQIGKEIEVSQYQGQIKGEDDKMIPKYARVKFDQGDAVYAKLSEYIDIEKTKKTGLGISANNYSELKPTKPRLQTGSNVDKISETRVEASVRESAYNNPNIRQVFSMGTPEVWSSPSAIKKNLTGGLSTKIEKPVVDNFVTTYLNNINQFKLQTFTVDDPRTTTIGDKVWAYRITNPNGKSIGETYLGVTNLDKDTKYLLDYQPQTFITEFIFQQTMNDQNFINSVFKK